MVAVTEGLLGDIISNWAKQTQSELGPFLETENKEEGDLVPVAIERKVKDKKNGEKIDIKGTQTSNRQITNKERPDKDDESNEKDGLESHLRKTDNTEDAEQNKSLNSGLSKKMMSRTVGNLASSEESNIDIIQSNYKRKLSSRSDRDLRDPLTSTPSSKKATMFSPNASPIFPRSQSVTSPVSSKMLTPIRPRQASDSPIISVNTSAAPKTLGLNLPSTAAWSLKITQRNMTLCAKKKENGRRISEDVESKRNENRDLLSSLTARSVDLLEKRGKSP